MAMGWAFSSGVGGRSSATRVALYLAVTLSPGLTSVRRLTAARTGKVSAWPAASWGVGVRLVWSTALALAVTLPSKDSSTVRGWAAAAGAAASFGLSLDLQAVRVAARRQEEARRRSVRGVGMGRLLEEMVCAVRWGNMVLGAGAWAIGRGVAGRCGPTTTPHGNEA